MPNNKILISFNDISTGKIWRLNSDGSLDSSFENLEFDNYVLSLCNVNYNRILVGGFFNNVIKSGISYSFQGLACLNEQGVFNDQFVLPSNFNSNVEKILIKIN